MAKRIEMIIIDPQCDFCDPNGALYVQGATEDMTRLSSMIKRIGKSISQIHVTLDSHHRLDVAHPIYWRNSKGEHPDPFTIISASDVKNGVWVPVFIEKLQKMINYTTTLEEGGKYPLCIWPPHCLIGSPGHSVLPILFDTLFEWEARPWIVNYITKGSNIDTEHYSAVKSEVPEPEDPSTLINEDLVRSLEKADIILLAGEAGSHCLANTGRDIVENFKNKNCIEKITLLTDATSPVTGFEQLQEDFISEMTEKGMQTTTTIDF